MAISVAALIVALCSLLWNIISAIHSWHKAKPAVRVETTSGSSLRDDGKIAEWLIITVRNRGGAATSVSAIEFWRKFSRSNGTGPLAEGIVFRADNRSELGPSVTGPDLPFTVASNHSQDWKFDLKPHERMLTAPPSPIELSLRIHLGTGETAERKLDPHRDLPRIFGFSEVEFRTWQENSS